MLCRMLALAATLTIAAVLAGATPVPPLQLVQTITLPGVVGRLDHLAIDLPGRRLFVAAFGNDSVEVVDLRAGARVGHIGGLHGPQGVLFVPALHRLFVANGATGLLQIFDGASLAAVGSVRFAADADNLRYDATATRLYVGYGRGALGVVDAAGGRRLDAIGLAAHPESFQLETGGARLFVNVPGADHIAVVDRRRGAVVATWPLRGARDNFPLALDEPDRRLFAGCRRPPRLLVLDTTGGARVASLEGPGDPDDLFYDAARHRLYLSGGAGFLDVFAQQDPDHYRRLARLPTGAGARTSLFVAALGRVYLARPAHRGQPAAIDVYAVAP